MGGVHGHDTIGDVVVFDEIAYGRHLRGLFGDGALAQGKVALGVIDVELGACWRLVGGRSTQDFAVDGNGGAFQVETGDFAPTPDQAFQLTGFEILEDIAEGVDRRYRSLTARAHDAAEFASQMILHASRPTGNACTGRLTGENPQDEDAENGGETVSLSAALAAVGDFLFDQRQQPWRIAVVVWQQRLCGGLQARQCPVFRQRRASTEPVDGPLDERPDQVTLHDAVLPVAPRASPTKTLGLTDLQPAAGPIAGTQPILFDKSLCQPDRMTVTLLPISAQTTRVHAQYPTCQIGAPLAFRQNQEARVVRHQMQALALLRRCPGDPLLAIGQTLSRSAPTQAGHPPPLLIDNHIADLLTHHPAPSLWVIAAHKVRPALGFELIGDDMDVKGGEVDLGC